MNAKYIAKLALLLLIHVAACVWGDECRENSRCEDFPDGNTCLTEPVCCFSMLEEVGVGEVVGNVDIVTDLHQILTTPNGTDSIDLLGTNDDFELDQTTGDVRLKRSVDRDAPDSPTCLSISINANGAEAIVIGVLVQDINDNAPTFPSGHPHSVSKPEGTNVRLCIGTIPELEAIDSDASPNGDITYSLAGEADDKFTINNETCIVNVVELDREEVEDPSNSPVYSLNLVLIATDGGNVSKRANTTLTVNITDINDNNPMFTKASLETKHILETAMDGLIIRDLDATDLDYNSVHTFSLLSDTSLFHVDSETGELSVATMGHGLTRGTYDLSVHVSDADRDNTSILRVIVQAVNVGAQFNFLGLFGHQGKVDNLTEEQDPDGFVIRYQIIDSDEDNTYIVKLSGDYTENFTRIHENFRLEVISIALSYPIDQESLIRDTQQSFILLSIEITEVGQIINITQNKILNITVVGINDNVPYLLETEFTTEEEKSDGITELQGHDPDYGKDGKIESYCVVSAVAFPVPPSDLTAEFEKHNPCHQITLISPMLDREAGIETIIVTMNLTDGGGRSNLVNITITLSDINDNYPIFDRPDGGYSIVIEENMSPSGIGSVVANDTDSGFNAEIRYELLNYRENFSVDHVTGNISALVPFDREVQDKYVIRISAVNVAPMVDTSNFKNEVEVEISIEDVNDNRPEWENEQETFTTSSDTSVGSFVIQLTADDVDLDSDITYQIRPSVLFDVSNSGIIRVEADLSDKIGSHNLLLTASDSKYNNQRNITIIVEKPASTSSPSVAVIGSVAGVCALVFVVVIVMVVVLCCVFFDKRRRSVRLSKRNGRLESDGGNSPTRGILRQIPSSSSGFTSRSSSTNGNSSRGVKFEPTVQKYGYDYEHAVNNSSDVYVTQSHIHLDSSGDESPVTPLRLPNSSSHHHHHNGKLPLDGHSHVPNGAPRLPPIQENFLFHAPHHSMRPTHPIQDDAYSDEDSEGNSDDDSTLPDNASSTNAQLPSVRHLSHHMASSPHSTPPGSHRGSRLPMAQISPSHQFPHSPEGLNPPRHDELSIQSSSSESLPATPPPVHSHMPHSNQRLNRSSARSSYPAHMPEGYIMPPSSARYGADPFMDRYGGTDFEDTSTYASAELDEALHFRPDQEPGIFSLTAGSSYDEESQL